MAILIYNFTESSSRDKENLTSLFKSIFPGNWKIEGDFLQGEVTQLNENPNMYGLEVFEDFITISSLKELANEENNLLNYTYLGWKITSWGYSKGKMEFELIDDNGQEADVEATFPFSLYKKATNKAKLDSTPKVEDNEFYVVLNYLEIVPNEGQKYRHKGTYQSCRDYVHKVTTPDEYGDTYYGSSTWWECCGA